MKERKRENVYRIATYCRRFRVGTDLPLTPLVSEWFPAVRFCGEKFRGRQRTECDWFSLVVFYYLRRNSKTRWNTKLEASVACRARRMIHKISQIPILITAMDKNYRTIFFRIFLTILYRDKHGLIIIFPLNKFIKYFVYLRSLVFLKISLFSFFFRYQFRSF